MGQGAAILDAAAAGGRRLQTDAAQAAAMEQRSRSFPSDARQRLNSLQAQQSAQHSGHKVCPASLLPSLGEMSQYDDGGAPELRAESTKPFVDPHCVPSKRTVFGALQRGP